MEMWGEWEGFRESNYTELYVRCKHNSVPRRAGLVVCPWRQECRDRLTLVWKTVS